MLARKPMETLEAKMLVVNSGSEEELESQMNFSDENWEGYCTPTGSIPILGLREPDKSSKSTEDVTDFKEEEKEEEEQLFRGRRNSSSADNDDNHLSTEEANMPEGTSLHNLLEENIQLRSRIEELEQAKPSTAAYDEEIQELKRQVEEANSYVDQVDIEAEQQYTELTSEIDELCTLVESKENEITRLREQLHEKKKENEKLQELYEQNKTNGSRQTEVIESLRDELDAALSRIRDLQKDRERQHVEYTTLKQQMDIDKGDILAKEVMMSIELEEVQRELNRQKEILDTTNVASIIDRWERRVRDLENQVSERDVIVHTQQAIINKLRVQSPPTPSRTPAPKLNSGGSSSESFHSQNGITSKEKSSLFSYILSDRHNQLANVYAIGKILDLTPNEEQYLEKILSQRANRFY